MENINRFLNQKPQLNIDEFLPKFNITKEQYEKTQLKWDELLKIYTNYQSKISKLEDEAS
ncbi:MAG: hypothetical protein IPQ02_09545 [Saprospiraceae bacterium]|nr:hypothetical protein [Candidatus Defluviibacterium haderslevense]